MQLSLTRPMISAARPSAPRAAPPRAAAAPARRPLGRVVCAEPSRGDELSNPTPGGNREASDPQSGDNPAERQEMEQTAAAAGDKGNRELDLESGDNPQERGAAPGAGAEGEGAAGEGASARGARGVGDDYGRFGVGDDEGAAEGGFRGAHLAQTGHHEGGGGGGGGEGTAGAGGGGRISPEELGRRAARAMEEQGGAAGCAERGEVAPPEKYPGDAV